MRTTIVLAIALLLSACGGGGSGSGAGASFDGMYRGTETLTFVGTGVTDSFGLTLQVTNATVTITDSLGIQWQSRVGGDGKFSALNTSNDGCANINARYQGRFVGNSVSGSYSQNAGCESAIRGTFSAQRVASRAPVEAGSTSKGGFKRQPQ